MTIQELVVGFGKIADEVEEWSPEAATAIRKTLKGEEISYFWLVRWNCVGREWNHKPDSRQRVVGHALVLAASRAGRDKKQTLPRIIPENCAFQEVWVRDVDPLNIKDVEDAKRARQLGLNVDIQPRYLQPESGITTTEDQFQEVVARAKPVWVDNALQGHVVVRYELGHDENGREVENPIFGEEIERGPGFAVQGVPPEWLGSYSNVTAYQTDGAKCFYAPLSNGGGGWGSVDNIPSDAEWRIPRHLVEELLSLEKKASDFFTAEREANQQARDAAERQRLAIKFGVSS